MRVIKSLGLVLSLFAFCAMNGQCPPGNFGPGGLCTQEAVASVILRIQDDTGKTLPYANFRYQVNDGQVASGFCQGNCEAFVIAFELTGRFDVEVTAPGFGKLIKTVDVVLDEAGCHPKTQSLSFKLAKDSTVAALAGVWLTDNFFGDMVLRFGDDGKVIGAIFYDRTIGGDGNFYVAYNGQAIRGATGQPIQHESAPEPTRSGNIFNFETVTLGIPTGFRDATLSADYLTLTGTLSGQAVVYQRLSENQTPNAIKDPL